MSDLVNVLVSVAFLTVGVVWVRQASNAASSPGTHSTIPMLYLEGEVR